MSSFPLPWRGGLSLHWAGNPSGLGHELMAHVQRAQGDMQSVVRQLIDEAPGWRHGIPSPDEPEGDRIREEDDSLRVTPGRDWKGGLRLLPDLKHVGSMCSRDPCQEGGRRIRSVVFLRRVIARLAGARPLARGDCR